MNAFEREELQHNLRKILVEFVPNSLPTRFILFAQLHFMDGTTLEVPGNQLEALLRERSTDPDSPYVVKLGQLLILVNLKRKLRSALTTL
jgi:hypothetical protein